jgi:hypothetical protein
MKPEILRAAVRPTAMPTLDVFEPAMCCSTGLCGPDPDAALVQFAADLKTLASEGVDVRRHNLGQTPEAFAGNSLVRGILEDEGLGVLPLLILDGRIVAKGRYPTRGELARLAGLGESGKPAPGASCCDPDSSGCC